MPKRSTIQSALSGNSDIAALGDDAKNWLCQALDPFPDYESNHMAGYPDIDGSNTVVQAIKGSFNVTKPAALAADATWDCHVFNLPEMMRHSTANARVFDANGSAWHTTAGTPAYNFGLLNAVSVASNESTVPYLLGTGAIWNPVGLTLQYADIGAYANGGTRVIGFGFEVHNTTASINKQGTVTVYKIPQTAELGFVTTKLDAGAPVPNSPQLISRSPPGSVNQAMLMAGSRQWEASEGVYVPITYSSIENPISGGRWLDRAFVAYDQNGNSVGFGNLKTDVNTPNQNCRPIPFNTHGSYFTGLSPSTTLTVTWKVYLERAPGPNLPDLAVLATPSAAYNPEVFKLYANIANTLPPGCKVGDNASGDWFRSVFNRIRQFAPIVAPLIAQSFGIPAPVGSAIGVAIAHKAFTRAGQEQKKKRSQPIVPPGMAATPPTFIPKGRTGTTVSYQPRPSSRVKQRNRGNRNRGSAEMV